MLLAAPLTGLVWHTLPASATSGSEPVKVRLDLAPDQSRYNAADERLRDAAGKLQLALNAEDVKVLLSHACSEGHSSCFAAAFACCAIANIVSAYNLIGLATVDGFHPIMRQLALTLHASAHHWFTFLFYTPV